MYVLEIIPLSRTAPPDPLSYRSSTKLAVGTLVDVPLRKKIVPGLVIRAVPVQEAKAELKAASFSLSKSSTIEHGTLPYALVEAAEKIALYHGTTLGAVLSTLIIPVLSSTLPKFSKGTGFSISYIENILLARRDAYKEILEKSSGATLLIAPTFTEVSIWTELLKKYKPIVLTSKITGKRREDIIARACESKGLVITTPGFSAIPISNLETICVERMSAGSYALPRRPYLDVRYALTELARAREITITYGDYPLPTEYRKEVTQALKAAPTGSIELYDARTKPGAERKAWQVLPNPIRDSITKTLSTGGRVAVLAVRRGYSPAVVCKDCSTTVTDENGRVLSLFVSGAGREYRSSDGKVVGSTEAFCKVCGGWNLMPLGIGIEQVEEELRTLFPEALIVPINADSTSGKELLRVREASMQPGAIIIGTEIMLSWLLPSASVDLAVIASADSLLALPFWRARERFVRVGLMLAERADHTIIVSRKPEDEAMDAILHPTTSTFWNDESELRKLLLYPPFGTLIIFHAEGSETQLPILKEQILKVCGTHVPSTLPDQTLSKNLFKATFILQLPKSAWPDATLSEKISLLTPAIRVHIDSETFW